MALAVELTASWMPSSVGLSVMFGSCNADMYQLL
jgi:hypothetical protein